MHNRWTVTQGCAEGEGWLMALSRRACGVQGEGKARRLPSAPAQAPEETGHRQSGWSRGQAGRVLAGCGH